MHPAAPPWLPGGMSAMGTWVRAALAFSMLPRAALAEVVCGGHKAENCAKCPQGGGEVWCNADCVWADGKCVRRDGKPDGGREPDLKGLRHKWGEWPMPPDVRPAGCKAPAPPSAFKNHTVSVVIPWLGESWQHLEGTLRALMHFTPDELIEEYMFVSDGNANTYEKELKSISPKVTVVALPQREGLIRAKMKGVALARGPVIVFMEAHCIVNKDWLEPLLERVVLHPKVLAMPFLDVIPPEDWYSYHPGFLGHWRYEWNFNLVLTNPGLPENSAKPFPSPGTSGGIFAMRKDWFEHLGLFDDGMLQWGGDHFELTMKVWRCGGRIEIVPCSRIGHVFRTAETRPYSVEVSQVVQNYARLALVWTPEHTDYFYKVKPEARSFSFDDLGPLHESHRRLKCRDMDWYLQNVDHELNWEKKRLCIPGAPPEYPTACKGPAAHGRSTVDQTMPAGAYEAAKKKAAQRAAKLREKKKELARKRAGGDELDPARG
eukprot:CAMPEP_0179360442 /NCGR_PEP_ID=MMETSP0797-20121207/79980_1 /TAXON_ID=47934 /ORGANISM="Dinophysis acuminata, Strain DAEP01" /LENGTH=488 /DNA_ID=CAMNT_0021075799 /DNA_START=23 /DNA_END=1486 /DNA_ORIENTATION=-